MRQSSSCGRGLWCIYSCVESGCKCGPFKCYYVRFRCLLDRVRHVLDVVVAVVFIKAPVLNSGDEDSGKLNVTCCKLVVIQNTYGNRQNKRRKLWPVDHLLTSSTLNRKISKVTWKDFKTSRLQGDQHMAPWRSATLCTALPIFGSLWQYRHLDLFIFCMHVDVYILK